MGDIEGALAALDSLKLGESIYYAATAKKNGVNRQPRVTRTCTEKIVKHRNLNTTQEPESDPVAKICFRILIHLPQSLQNFASKEEVVRIRAACQNSGPRLRPNFAVKFSFK